MICKDQMGRALEFGSVPRRIVSVVPSQTELLYDLGAPVVGITKFCVHPEAWFRSLPRVGGTKQLHFDRIAALEPDLIIANKEENERSQIEYLAERYPVWISDIHTLDDSIDMITALGHLLQRNHSATFIAQRISEGFDLLEPLSPPQPAAYLIWREPWMVAGGDTFINDMLRRCGFRNVFEDLPRYPEINLARLAASGCRHVLLSSEPFPFAEKHIAEIREFLPDADIRLVDGEMFSWYGSRLLEAPGYFSQLLQLG
ncbi:helical backbone metal receptor [Chitinophaga lutea]